MLIDGPAGGHWNMAVDETLLDSLASGGTPVLRLYSWARPTLSFGRNQPALRTYHPAVLDGLGIEAVRRPTGGRAVLHDREITYSAVFPDRLLGGPRRAYRCLNEILVSALRALGLGAAVLAPENGAPPPQPSGRPCFADPVAGEVIFQGRKLVGSAQRRVGGSILQHGSIPLSPSPLLPRLAAAGLPLIDGTPVYLRDALTYAVEDDTVVERILEAWGQRLGALGPTDLSESERARAESIAARYADPAWTWLR